MGSRNVWTLLATLGFLQAASCVTIEAIRLIGDSDSYIDVKTTHQQVLQCKFHAGYDDQIQTVEWFKDHNLVYSWDSEANSARVYGSLLGYAKTSDVPELQNLNLKKVSLDLSGNYTCKVTSTLGVENSNPFHLVILDVPSDDFSTNVTLMSSSSEPASTSSSSPNCTLLWDFRTPAIYPKPNVTCGYYSYLHDDVIDALPAGLTMHLLNNGSWQAGFDHTHVKVSDIPRKERLGCAISVPDTNYKKVIKFEDGFVIDHLIDSEGCPTVALDSIRRLSVSSEGGVENCRGDLVPSSLEVPSKIRLRCERNDIAILSNGTRVPNWSLEMICDPEMKVWMMMTDGVSSPVTNITNVLPLCVPSMYHNGSSTICSTWTALSIVLSLISGGLLRHM